MLSGCEWEHTWSVVIFSEYCLWMDWSWVLSLFLNSVLWDWTLNSFPLFMQIWHTICEGCTGPGLLCGVDEFTHWPHWVGLQNMMRRLCLIIVPTVPVSPHVPASHYTCKLGNTNTGVTGVTPQLGKQFSKYKSNIKIDIWKQLDPVYLVLMAVLQTDGRMKLQIEPLWEGVERGMEEAGTGDVTTAWSVITDQSCRIVRTPGHGQDVALLIVKFSNFDIVRHRYSQIHIHRWHQAPCSY